MVVGVVVGTDGDPEGMPVGTGRAYTRDIGALRGTSTRACVEMVEGIA